ncbi:hypothetical protein MRX96_036896 [Rhipicephalus microplus]
MCGAYFSAIEFPSPLHELSSTCCSCPYHHQPQHPSPPASLLDLPVSVSIRRNPFAIGKQRGTETEVVAVVTIVVVTNPALRQPRFAFGLRECAFS